MENSVLIPINGYVKFSNYLEVEDSDIKIIKKCSNILENNINNNSIWDIFKELGSSEILNKYQKNILNCLAMYCDIYPEAIHSIQWQEKINIIVDNPGKQKIGFNPSSSFIKKNGTINNAPFNRSLVVEAYIYSNYDGGKFTWDYLDFNDNTKSGDIVIYPASFLWSRKESSIINGNRIYLRTFFNGGKDFFMNDEELDVPGTEFLFSYMR